MKKIVLTIYFMCMALLAFSQWTIINPTLADNSLNSVYFPNADTGYAVGDSGTILKTTDGGTTWAVLVIETNDYLHSVYFTNANTGYLVGYDGSAIIKTIDGGITWTFYSTVFTSLPVEFTSVYFINTDVGYIVGEICAPIARCLGIIFKTTDGGETWTHIIPGTIRAIFSVYFADANKGYVAGAEGTFLKTMDGGITWNTICRETTEKLTSICFPETNTGYILGEQGTILKTTDGGTNWNALASGIPCCMTSVYFTDANTGYIVGMDGIINKTYDGGTTWTALISGTTNGLNSVYFTDANTGYVVGDHGTILKTTNGGINVKVNETTAIKTKLSICPNPANKQINIEIIDFKGNARLTMYNVNGKKVMEREMTEKKMEMDISSLVKGVYVARIVNEDAVEIGKIIKE